MAAAEQFNLASSQVPKNLVLENCALPSSASYSSAAHIEKYIMEKRRNRSRFMHAIILNVFRKQFSNLDEPGSEFEHQKTSTGLTREIARLASHLNTSMKRA